MSFGRNLIIKNNQNPVRSNKICCSTKLEKHIRKIYYFLWILISNENYAQSTNIVTKKAL